MTIRAGRILAVLTAGLAAGPGPAGAQDASTMIGTWAGTLDTGGAGTLRIVFHLTSGDAGSLDATMDSPDQGAFGIAAGPVTVEGGSIRIEVPAAAGHYEGVIDEGGRRIEGTWNQGGASLPLVLEPSEDSEPPLRPQEPKEPYPYEATDVSFESVAPGVTLAGTLTVPPGGGPHPAVVLVSGSGPQ
ncbi:MAG: alpha/beta hydrolase family protein, partial [Gemmatimonadota bacterium]